MKKLHVLSVFALILSGSFTAQNSNIFHERDFWQTNPNIYTIDKKIAEGNDISELNSNAFDGVVYAILEKTDNKTIKHLLSKKGNDVNKKTHDGRTYIFWASYSNNLELMKYLVSKGAKTNLVDSHGYTVLNFTANAGQLNKKLYEYLFKMGADIKTEKNHSGANALLLIAPHTKDFSLIKYLTSNGASINDKDNDGNGIFEYASKGGNIAFLKMLVKRKVTIGTSTMIFASQGLQRKKNNLKTFKFLESIGVKVNVIDKKGRNSLHAIAYNSKDLATYSYFINKGVNTNLQDNEGNSPFMNATKNNTLDVVKFLSKHVKDYNLSDENRRSALVMAVHKNSADVIEFLLEKTADIHTKDGNNNTLSYYLIDNYKANKPTLFEEKLKLLEKNGLVFNQIQNSGNTLLHIATERNNLALLKRLAPYNINVNLKNKEGLTALQSAAMMAKDTKIIQYLMRIGADKNVKTDFNESVYDLASENELLKKNNVDINFLK
ncbi:MULTISPECIES: ankyrin repeat domain-containing protein [unclassified Polaribacter]|uniref:ankyrin repeat domain-containing protein n=1 Tax=unclassified Polaribacter TaxID=196858 RepID=UPI0011BEDEE9|nr:MULTISPECIES: ankyrin repeat domain-containing protein [unclassified Polaribacter]TXD54431.1 ankyrin repeat domain-containing protein [Polaribacter sp. IC063]TXD60344.1 ankyrin repeat domain-containing protein [Polaribacter sp. IC066]